MSEQELQNFKSELRDLLHKYNVGIGVDLSDDCVSCKFVVSQGKSEYVLRHGQFFDESDLPTVRPLEK